jgi:hypothetical protein
MLRGSDGNFWDRGWSQTQKLYAFTCRTYALLLSLQRWIGAGGPVHGGMRCSHSRGVVGSIIALCCARCSLSGAVWQLGMHGNL